MGLKMSRDARLGLPPGRIGASTTNYRKNEERERKKASLVEMNSRRGTRSSKHDSKTSMTRYAKPEFGDNGESLIYPPALFSYLRATFLWNPRMYPSSTYPRKTIWRRLLWKRYTSMRPKTKIEIVMLLRNERRIRYAIYFAQLVTIPSARF